MTDEKVNKTDIWFPLYIGDYIADTMHLDATEHGIYLMLIMHYWRTGPLTDNEKILMRVAKCPEHLWPDAWSIVQAFFEHTGSRYTHKRIEKEIAESRSKKEKASEKAKLAAKSRWDNAASNATSNATSIEQAMLDQCPSPSPSPSPLSLQLNTAKKFIKPTINEIKSYCISRKNTVDAEKFYDHYESNGWKVGKNQMKNWQAAVRTWEKSTIGATKNGSREKLSLAEQATESRKNWERQQREKNGTVSGQND